jgi:hypothetical protein
MTEPALGFVLVEVPITVAINEFGQFASHLGWIDRGVAGASFSHKQLISRSYDDTAGVLQAGKDNLHGGISSRYSRRIL